MQINEILNALQTDYAMKNRGRYYREGVCPHCKKKTLFIETQNPTNIKCGRLNHCGWEMPTRELYPEYYQSIEAAYPATPNNPNATADAYLKKRGFELSRFKHEYRQVQCYEYKALSDPKRTEAIEINIASGFWQRYITPIAMEDGIKKANFGGQRKSDGSLYRGNWYSIQDRIEYQKEDEVFITEGIFDAWSLIQSGKNAHAAMSCNNFPEIDIRPYLRKGIKWVIALDNDKAGKKYAKQWYKKLNNQGENVRICIAAEKEKKDWNDYLIEQKKKHPTRTAKIPHRVFEECFYQGNLLTATSASKKAELIFNHSSEFKKRFTFEFNKSIYHAAYSEKNDEIDLKISRICNCLPEFLYFQRDVITHETHYYMRVRRQGNKNIYRDKVKNTDISSSQRFKEKLLCTAAGLHFRGNNQQLSRYLDDFWFDDPNPPEIATINFIGYAKEFKAWIFSDSCIYNGTMYSLNKDDYFDISDKLKIKTSYCVEPLKLSENNKSELWYEHFKTAYGSNGLFALSFWFGTLFAEQMRTQLESWPFLELSGKPGTGKTKLLEFLWKLIGRADYEGVDLAKATHSGRWRTFSQLANIPTVLIEGDRQSGDGHQSQQFDMNETKPLYNGRGLRITSQFTAGNETHEPPFRSALVIAQNAMVEADEAVMERICHLNFTKENHTPAGEHSVNALIDLDINDINGFLTQSCKQEQKVMERIKFHYHYYMDRGRYQGLNGKSRELSNRRIKHNFFQVFACALTMEELGIVKIPKNDLAVLYEHVVERAWLRHQATKADHPLIEEFFEMVDYLESTARGNRSAVNHHKDSANMIAINFPQFNKYARDHNQQISNQRQLKQLLKQAHKNHEFIAYKAVFSSITNKNIKCFVFKKK